MLQSFITQGSLKPDLVSISEFSQEYSEMLEWSVDQVREYFLLNGWEEVKHELDSCFLWMDGENNSTYFSIATWGKGRGAVVLGPRSRPVARAIDEFLSGIRLEPGACQWEH